MKVEKIKYIVIPQPNYKRGHRMKNVFVCDNKGDVVYTEWKEAKSARKVIKMMNEIIKNESN